MRPPERVEQPQHIQVPTEDDPLAWAKYPIVYSQWLSSVAPQFQAEEIAGQIILAETLECFTVDDDNLFAYIASGRYTSELGRLAHQEFQIRIKWERSVPFVPRRIKNIMGRVGNLLVPLDWSNPVSYEQAVLLRKPLVERARHIIAIDDVCDEAIEARLSNKEIFAPAWEGFLKQFRASR